MTHKNREQIDEQKYEKHITGKRYHNPNTLAR